MDFSPIILSNPPAFLRTFALTHPAASIDTGALPLPLYRHGEGTIYLEGEGEESAFLLEAFVLSRSKVLKLSSVRSSDALTACLARVTAAMEDHQDAEGQPLAFTIRDDWAGPHVLAHDECWVVFPTHEQARSALSLSLSNGVLVNLKAALETDLEPQTKLQLLDGGYRTVSASPTESPTDSITRTTGSAITNPHNVGMGLLLNSNFQQIQVKYNLSSNPPNPKVTFRTGDWLCSIPSCNAHNFGRNMACYGCGNPRHIQTANTMNTNNIGYGLLNTNNSHSHPSTQQPHSSHPATIHHALGAAASRTASPSRTQAPHGGPIVGLQVPSKPPAPSYPLLTPSGHALASGGRVMNISRDGVALCFMYWPDNEPLPERGQIRPLGSAVIQYPPIINTGNKGAAEKQPGDWVCSKCNYLNWRRRKVCQTCYPYAEGNGDSISQAVQAERIALLTNVLNQVDATTQLPLNLQRRSSVPVNAVAPAPAVYGGAQPPFVHPPNPASRPRSQMDLRTQYHPISPVPGPCANGFAYPQQPQHQYAAIYQTPSYPSSPRTNTSPARSRVPSPTANALASPPLLPSFLQDIIQSDSAQSSPATSTSSWSFDELEYGGHPSAYRYTKFDPLREGAHASVVGPHQVGVIGQPRRSAGATESSQAKASAMYQSPSASTSSDLGLSIWRMDDTESRTFGLGNSGRAAPVYNGKERSVEAVVDLAARFGNKLSLISA